MKKYTEAKKRIEILESCTRHMDENFFKYMHQEYNKLNNILDEEVDSIYLKQLEKYLGVQPSITFYEDELKARLRGAIKENKPFNMMDAYNWIRTEEEMQALEEK